MKFFYKLIKTKKRRKKVYFGAGLAETLVALGIVGTAIFTMLVLAAKTSRQARINQERYVGSQAAGDGIALAIANRTALKEHVCGIVKARVGVLGNEIVTEDNLLTVISGDNQYKLLPLAQNAETGQWERCHNCTADTAYVLRGLEIERIEEDRFWDVKSIVYWKTFGTAEEVIISTRLDDICE